MEVLRSHWKSEMGFLMSCVITSPRDRRGRCRGSITPSSPFPRKGRWRNAWGSFPSFSLPCCPLCPPSSFPAPPCSPLLLVQYAYVDVCYLTGSLLYLLVPPTPRAPSGVRPLFRCTVVAELPIIFGVLVREVDC